jgi:hypothetical protein
MSIKNINYVVATFIWVRIKTIRLRLSSYENEKRKQKLYLIKIVDYMDCKGDSQHDPD